jgi:hypothetical protein
MTQQTLWIRRYVVYLLAVLVFALAPSFPSAAQDFCSTGTHIDPSCTECFCVDYCWCDSDQSWTWCDNSLMCEVFIYVAIDGPNCEYTCCMLRDWHCWEI